MLEKNIDLADLDPLAFDDGLETFNSQEAEIANPYKIGSVQNRAWKAGWDVAFEASLRFFPTTIKAVEAEELRQASEAQ